MHKQLIIIGLGLAVAACQPSTQEVSTNYRIPKGLEDCHFYRMSAGGISNSVLVVRCPRSDTSTQQTQSCGKGCSKSVQSATSESEDLHYDEE